MNNTNLYYREVLKDKGFKIDLDNDKYNKMGTVWKLSSSVGEGEYWIYERKNLYNIKIQDFYYYEDSMIDVKESKCLAVTYFESICGKEFYPYRAIKSNSLKAYICDNKRYKAILQKKIPIKSISVQIFPEYYKKYLDDTYFSNYKNLEDYFKSVNDKNEFQKMLILLNQIKNYRGEGMAGKLFYDAKVFEIISLIVENKEVINDKDIKITEFDREMLMSVTSYINDHYAFKITLEQLSKIACMGTTKLKLTFKLLHGCTITEYIQRRRMSEAEHLLRNTNLTISEVSQTVGYSSCSRFSKLFKNNTGMLPKEYKKIINN